jgi:hypothetical protein
MEWNDSSQASRFIYKLNPPALPGKRWSARTRLYMLMRKSYFCASFNSPAAQVFAVS